MKLKRLLLFIILSLLLASLAAGCGAKTKGNPSTAPEDTSQNQQEKSVEIVFQSFITPNLTEQFWNDTLKRFNEKYPNIHVNRVAPPDTAADKYTKTMLATGNVADVLFNLTTSDFVKANALMPIAIDDDIKKIKNYDSQFFGGKLYSVNATLQPHNLIFYNKKLFAEAGISDVPKTWSDFETTLEKLKSKGIAPLLTGGEWVTGFQFDNFLATDVYVKNPRWSADLNAGKVHFTDPDWVTGANRFASWIKKGYFSEGSLGLGYDQLEPEFMNGKIAMYPMGVWFTASKTVQESPNKDDIGVFPTPSEDGKVHLAGGVNDGGFSIYKETKHPEEALKLLKFLVFDPVVHKTMIQTDGLYSNFVEPVKYDMNPLQSAVFDLIQQAASFTPYIGVSGGDNSPPAGLVDTKINPDVQSLFINRNPNDILNDWQKYVESHK